MTVGTKDEQAVQRAVNAAVERYGNHREELIPILSDVNRTLGYLPAEALDEISQRLRVPKSQLFSVASFYQMLSTKPRGHACHPVLRKRSLPCGGRARRSGRHCKSELKLKAGETSPDGKWTLVTVACLGVCGVGPVIMIDDDIYGNRRTRADRRNSGALPVKEPRHESCSFNGIGLQRSAKHGARRPGSFPKSPGRNKDLWLGRGNIAHRWSVMLAATMPFRW